MKLPQNISASGHLWTCLLLVALLYLMPAGLRCQEPAVDQLLRDAAGQYEQRRFDSAVVLGQMAVALIEQTSPPDSSLLETAVCRTGLYGTGGGDFETAIKLWLRGLDLKVQRLGPDHPDVAVICHGLGNLYYWYGDYSEAELFYRRAMAIREKAFGPEHWIVAANINNLANLAYDRGDFAESERLHRQALLIREKSLKPGDRELAKSYSGLADLAVKRGETAEAVAYYCRSLNIIRSTLGEVHTAYFDCLKGLAITHRKRAEYDTAGVLLRSLIESGPSFFGGPHRHTADVVQELAAMSWERGMTDSAVAQYSRSLDIRAEASALFRPEQAACYEALSNLYLDQGDAREAREAATTAVSIRQRNFLQNGDILPEHEALLYSEALRISVSNCVRIGAVARLSEDYSDAVMADIMLATKGLVSDVLSERRSTLIKQSDPELQEQVDRVEYLRRRVSRLFVRGAGDDAKGHARKMHSLRLMVRDAESELLRTCRPYRQLARHQQVSSETILDLLPPGAALLEYYRTVGGITDADIRPDRFVAVLVRNEQEVRVVDLGPASTTDSLMNDYRAHIMKLEKAGRLATESDLKEYRLVAGDLHNTIWAPLESYLRGTEQVFVAPDGTLNLLSFAGLVCPDNSYLCEKVTVHYLTAGRDLVRILDNDQTTGSGLLAIGDPDFNAIATPGALASQNPDSERSHITRSLPQTCQDLSDMVVSPLPSSRHEINAIAAAWHENTREQATVCLGTEANEARFKREALGKRAVYLATHGYYLRDSCDASPDQSASAYGQEPQLVNPLLKSGLFLAGANRLDSEIEGVRVEDGVLTAYEVSGLDITGTELVVLSACETGLGKVRNAEGVYGLRKAFQMAGAHTVISALWRIPDQATAELMSGVWSSGESSLAAGLRTAQLARLNDLRLRGLVDHPIDWAAFTAAGDWR